MARAIYCEPHGSPKPLHPEDVARGLTQRYVIGTLRLNCVCDRCNKPLAAGVRATAWSMPAKMPRWADEYFNPASKEPL